MKKTKIILSVIIYFFFINISLASNNDCVILLHGLARTNYSMSKLALTLTHHQYTVVNDNYPSTKKTIEELTADYLPPMINKCLNTHPNHIHFVTHSLGGIILEEYLRHHTLPKLEYIVMLAPPNHGSPLADRWYNNRIIKQILGPVLADLTTQRNTSRRPPGHYKIGVIAGSVSLNPIARGFFHEPNDGSVAVSSTKMQKMDDFIVLPVSHTFIMRNDKVIEKILHFLIYGRFHNSTSKNCSGKITCT